jgi:hypothetical protein
MRLSAIALALSVTLASIGCGEPGSPVSPSSIQPDSSSGLAGTAGSPAATSSASASVTLAIRGRVQGDADPPVFEPPPSPYFTAHLLIPGEASHVGRFTYDLSHRVNLNTLEGTGTAVFTFPKERPSQAKQDDRLMTTVEGTATPAGGPTAFTVVETHKVTGGTGRFAGASGEFTITRAVDFTDPFTSGEIVGWISMRRGRF